MVRLALVFALILLTTTATAQTPATPKWEYCALSRSLVIGGGGVEDLTLQMPTEKLESNSFAGLAGQLSIRVNEIPNSTTILNFLGGNGWELVSHTEIVFGQLNQFRLNQAWTFKRPK